MQEVSSYQQELSNRISPIVDNLFKSNSLYLVKLKKWEMMEMLVDLFGQLSPEEMRAINEHELIRRIRKILTLEAVSGTLDDLSPEQIAIFDAAVEGRYKVTYLLDSNIVSYILKKITITLTLFPLFYFSYWLKCSYGIYSPL